MDNIDAFKENITATKQAVEKMKYEIANEIGIPLGLKKETSKKMMGGEVSKQLAIMGMNKLESNYQE